MSRLAPFDYDALTPEQKEVADAIRSGPRGGMRGPFEAWLNSPQLATHAQLLGAHVRFGTKLPRDVSELAIILTGKHWTAQFEFWAHARLAKEAGLPDAVIEAVRTGKTPLFDRADLQFCYDIVTEYFRTSRLSPETYASAVETWGLQGIVDLIGTVGYYGMVSMTLNIFEVGLPEGEAEPLTLPASG